MDVAYLLAISQAVFFIFFLLFQRSRYQANYLLMAWLFMICVSLVHSYLIRTGLIVDYLFFLGIDAAVPYICGPFLLVYSQLLTGKIKQITKKELIHFVPFVGYSIYSYFILLGTDDTFKLSLLGGSQSLYSPIQSVVVQALKIVHSLTYTFFTFKLISAYRKANTAQWKSHQKSIARWLHWLVGSLIVINIMMAGAVVGFLIPIKIFSLISLSVLSLTLFGVIYLIVFFALKYPGIFHQGAHSMTDRGVKKYTTSTLTNGEKESVWQKLLQHLEANRSYEDVELNISKLAEQIDVHSKALSQVINENAGTNFTNFINGYRIEAFKAKVGESKYSNLTLVAIAYECGFSSKSSFHSIFKKFEGCTPKQFLNETSSIQVA